MFAITITPATKCPSCLLIYANAYPMSSLSISYLSLTLIDFHCAAIAIATHKSQIRIDYLELLVSQMASARSVCVWVWFSRQQNWSEGICSICFRWWNVTLARITHSWIDCSLTWTSSIFMFCDDDNITWDFVCRRCEFISRFLPLKQHNNHFWYIWTTFA